MLEEGVVVLAAVADGGVLGVERAVTELLQLVPVEHLAQVLVIQHVDLLDLVAGAEAVKEVLHGDGPLMADRCATAPRSMHSCTLEEASWAQPV